MRGINRVLIQITKTIFFSVFLAGCISSATELTPTVFTPAITSEVVQLTLSVSTQTPSQEPQKDLQCMESGWVERYLIDSALMNGELYFSVYFPPCYSETKTGGYPVLYALHGQNFNDGMWMDLGAAKSADALVIKEETEPFLIVMPFEEFFYRKAEGNAFPQAIKEEIIPWVEGSFNVCAEKACRAIGGISRGASWAIRIGLMDHDIFSAVGIHSLPTFYKDINGLAEGLDDIPYGEEPRIYLDTGRFDPKVKNAYRFENILNEKGIPHEWHLNEGRHNEVYWEEQMNTYLRWYAAGWEHVN